MPSRVYVLNPVGAILTEYGPLSHADVTNSPRPSVVISRGTPVPWCVDDTRARYNGAAPIADEPY